MDGYEISKLEYRGQSLKELDSFVAFTASG